MSRALGPEQLPRLWTWVQTHSRSCSGFCQWQLLVWNPGCVLAPGELLLWHLLPTNVLPPAALQGADELPSTGDAGPGVYHQGMFSPLG